MKIVSGLSIPIFFSLGLLSQSSDAWQEKARELLSGKRHSEALTFFDEAKRKAPQDPNPYFYSGVALAELGRLSEAAAELRGAIRLDPKTARYGLVYADVLANLGDDTAAVKALEAFGEQSHAVQLTKERLWLLSDLYFRLGRFDEALRALGWFAEREPEDERLDLHRGEIYLAAGNLDPAEVAFRKALQRSTDEAGAHYGLGFALWMKNELEDSKQALLAAVERDPSNAKYLRQLGEVCLARQESEAAIGYLERADAAGPKLPQLYRALGRAYRKAGKPERANEYLEKFEALMSSQQSVKEKGHRLQYLMVQGKTQLEKGQVSESLRLFHEALEVDPDLWVAHSFLAKLYISSRYWEQARQHLSKLEKLAPEAYEGRYLMALFWYERGDPERALQYGEEAKELWPGDPTLRNLMGNILSSLGRLESALEEYSAAVAMAPDQVAYEMNYEVLARRLGK
jgi:tetratricopeptide (TPR) repeat protein